MKVSEWTAMERNRGVQRTSTENFNVISKRRHRISEEQRQMEETMRSRDRERINKKERDRLNGKRKRVEKTSSIGSDGSSENNGEDEERRVSRGPNLPPNQQLHSSSKSNRHRKPVVPESVAAKPSPVNGIIGVHIPKKARSVKRTYEHCNSGTGRFWEEKNHRRLSPLSTSLCVDGGLPSSSSISSKTQILLGSKARRHMICSYSSSLVQDEIEVAEALFDLMKQSHSPSQSLSPSQGSMKRSDLSNEKICSNSSVPAQTSDLPREDDGNAVSVQNGSVAEIKTQEQSRDPKRKENSEKEKELVAEERAETKVELVVSAKVVESQSCANLGADNLSDSTATKIDPTVMVVETKQKTNSEVVPMASPVPLCLERQGLNESVSPPDFVAPEGVVMRDDEQKLKGELCKAQHQVQKEHNQCQNAVLNEKKIAQPSLFTLPAAMAGRSGEFLYPGYTPAVQTILPIDPSIRSSIPMKSPPFVLSLPRPKKCITHQYIALNIKHHQKLVKSSKWCAPAGPDLNGAKPQNHSPMPSAHPLLGDVCGGQRLNTRPFVGGKDQTSEITNIGDSSKDKQLVLQPPLLLFSASNSMHGPDLMFPLRQHKTVAGSPINQSGSPMLGKASLPSNSAVRGEAAFNPSSLPAEAATISFKAPPMMPMVQNNGYPFSISNNVEMISPYIPNVPGPCYSPTFQTFKTHQEPVSHNARTSSGSSSSHRKAHSHQQKGRNSYLMSTSHIPPPHPSKKPGTDISTQNSAVISKHTSRSQKPSSGQHLSTPFQPINFALMPPGILGTGGKVESQQWQQGCFKVGKQLIPQTVAGSVGSTASATPTLNLSSIAQNPPILHSLPDMSRLSVFVCHPTL